MIYASQWYGYSSSSSFCVNLKNRVVWVCESSFRGFLGFLPAHDGVIPDASRIHVFQGIWSEGRRGGGGLGLYFQGDMAASILGWEGEGEGISVAFSFFGAMRGFLKGFTFFLSRGFCYGERVKYIGSCTS